MSRKMKIHCRLGFKRGFCNNRKWRMATEKREIGQNVGFGKTGEIARVFSVTNGRGKTLWCYCSVLNCNQWSKQNTFHPIPKEHDDDDDDDGDDDDDDDVCMISTGMIHDYGKSGHEGFLIPIRTLPNSHGSQAY